MTGCSWILRSGLCALGLFITLSVRAQSGGMLSGVVLDARSLSPVDGATVLAAGTLWGTLTDAEGRFVLGPLRAGMHTIVVTARGYQELMHEVRIMSDSTVNVDWTMNAAYTEIRKFSPLVSVPAAHGSPSAILTARLEQMPGVFPVRTDGLDVIAGMRGLAYQNTALYIDGIRMLEAPGRVSTSMTLMSSAEVDQVLMAGGPYGVYWGPLALGGWYITRAETLRPTVEMAYDTRLRSFRTGAVYSKRLPTRYGELSAMYVRAGHYTDGSGTLQPGSAVAGMLKARGRMRLGVGHKLEGQGGVQIRSGDLAKNEQVLDYSFTRDHSLLESIVIQLSRQQWEGNVGLHQQSGRLAIRLRPGVAWRVDTGLDYFRLTLNHRREKSAFARLTHTGERIDLMLMGRADRIIVNSQSHYGWHLQTSANWRLSRAAELFAGMGRSDSFADLGVPRLVQVDTGLLLNRSTVIATTRAWMRWTMARQARGIDMQLVMSAFASPIELLVTTTVIDHADFPPVWGRVGAQWESPGRVLQLGADMKAAARKQGTRAWATCSFWLQVAGWRLTELSITALNLFNRTYTRFAPEALIALPEPGRSISIAARFHL